MATIAVNSGSYIRPYRPCSRIVHFAPEANQAYLKGTPVIFSTDTDQPGTVTEDSTDPTGIVGIAATNADAAGLADALWVADEESEFVAHVQDAGIPTLADIGASRGLVKDTTNSIYRVDLSDSTNVSVKIVDVLDPGDTNGRVVVKFLNAARTPFSS